jgi:2-haloacid dehalogenase
MIDFDRFEVLTFDCYGTLIDWEAGICRALRPVFEAHRVAVPDEALLASFGTLEGEIEAGPYKSYRAVLAETLQGLGAKYGFAPSVAERDAFAGSVGDWPAFADSAEALAALKRRYKLAIVSNVDDDLFALSNRRLGVAFDWIVTAQQARSYKPSPENFRLAFARIGVPPERILHVAQSLFHDHVPAKRLGMTTVWINRRQGKEGPGATPPADAEPDLMVPDMASFARLALG